jgi:hypothetical protein
MKPVNFEEVNIIVAENQKEYNPLPSHVSQNGQVISCWEMDEEERKEFEKTGKVWLIVHTFGQPLQPLVMEVIKPFVKIVWEEVEEQFKAFKKSLTFSKRLIIRDLITNLNFRIKKGERSELLYNEIMSLCKYIELKTGAMAFTEDEFKRLRKKNEIFKNDKKI